MDILNSNIKVLFDRRSSSLKSYRLRYLIQTTWYLILFGTATILLYMESGIVAFYFIGPLLTVWLIWDYLSERRFEYTTLYISLDTHTETLTIENIDKKNCSSKMNLKMNEIKIKLKELRLGQFYVPNYELIISKGESVSYRQKGNFIISGSRIKEVANKLIEHQILRGNQKPKDNFSKTLKKKIKTLANST